MERPVSRRRHRVESTEQRALETPKVEERNPASEHTKSRALARGLTKHLVEYIAALTLLGYFLFLWASQLPRSSPLHAVNHCDFGADAPTRLQDIHPDDHVYRPAKTIRLDWNITTGMRRPDGVLKRVYLINDLFPGPTIEARSGDRMIVTLHNKLENEETSIHWHGLHMKGANRMDGAASVTQCPIPPGASFIYDFKVSDNQSGTFWYHSHSSLQRMEGLFGALIVHKPAPVAIGGHTARHLVSEVERYGYDKEVLMMVGDWYHQSPGGIVEWYMSAASWGNEPVPDSLLINGAGHFPCERMMPAKPLDCIDKRYVIPHLKLDPKTTYRVRAINVGTLAGVSLAFKNHEIEVIKVDGGIDVRSFVSEAQSLGVLHSGQRVDFILSPDREDQNNSSFTVNLDREDFQYPNPAMISEQAYPILPLGSESPTMESAQLPSLLSIPSPAHIDLAALTSAPDIQQGIPQQANQTFVVYANVMKKSINGYKPYSYFNHTSWKPQADPPVPLLDLPQRQWDKNQLAIDVPGDQDDFWVDLVVNNRDEGPHPFHMHGHDFHVLSVYQADIGFGSYNPFAPSPPRAEYAVPPFDLSKSLQRDTIQVPPHGHAVLRFKADNPGVWFSHCHVMWHLGGGMAMVIDARTDDEKMKVVRARGECR